MDKPYVIGIDVGGTNTVVGIVDKRGQILRSGSLKTAKHAEVEDYLDELKEWHAGTVPWCDHADSDKKPDPEEIRAVLESFAGKKNKALLLGAMHRQEDQEMACRLAKRLGWRVLPDILSNCRRNEN